ncbi:hypothetical protein [Sediminitomix flava]|uniref:Uncharacterized protein n=1 Tax=Sediminitomix flava TaxID=379075 RepID=A0A315ZIB4_SEDFL|nr:hypothetical protein [Sediminitomix flava]PWJ33121.1 hypothetical protein BC781_1157 [Sediminitomix flava]
MIRQICIITFLTFGIRSLGFSQQNDILKKNIRQKFNYIVSINDFETIQLENEEFLEQMTDGGGTLTAYIKNDSIYKIMEWVGLSYGVIQTEYYYWDSRLFFAYQTEEVFNFVYHMADTVEIEMSVNEKYSLKKTSDRRYYFSEGELIDLVKSGKEFYGAESDIEATKMIQDLAKSNFRKVSEK